VLYEELYLSLTRLQQTDGFLQAGILGALYFATSLSIQYLSTRLRHSEITSLNRAVEIADLERINRRIVQRMRTGIIVVSQDEAIRMANASARSLLGLADQKSSFHALPRDLNVLLDDWRNDTTVRNPPFHISATTPEILVNFSAVRMDHPAGDVIIFLEDTADIQQQAQHLKLAALGRLSAGIAHEIRNPLGAISHAAQLLSESKNLDRGDERLTHIIHTHCQRMNGVVKNVLEMSQRQQPKAVKLLLGPWIDKFAMEFRQYEYKDADIHVTVEPEDMQVRIDRSQITQVLTNLALNGLRYSVRHCGKPILDLVGGMDAATDRPYLNVIDHGTGVAPDEEKNLFEPFYTTESTGSGLGLYISRELCEVNHARLSYTRHEHGGSCFRITFAHPDRITV
jgi:two-component system sensor histidine kinase PilS (NtrC family)